MSIVVDASVALKWVIDEPDSDIADTLLDEDLSAPALWLLEAANALWKLVRRGDLTSDQARTRRLELQNAPVATSAIETDIAAAIDLAILLSHPVYDCLYLAAAVRENTYVVTVDRRFHAAAQQQPDLADRVRLLSR